MLRKNNILKLFRAITAQFSYARPKNMMFYDQEPIDIQPFINTEITEKSPGIRIVYIRTF